MSPSENWGRQKLVKMIKPEEAKSKIKGNLKDKLESMSMQELRDFVKERGLKAKDTKKEELIEEILKEVLE